MRPIIATIDLSAFAHNLEVVRAYAPQSRVMAVVKANAYGHGLLAAAKGLEWADGFAVLGINEAICLRQNGYQQTLLLLEGVFSPQELLQAAKYDITPVVHHDAQLSLIEEAVLEKPIHVFAKMNTGMNRLGFSPASYSQAVARLQACHQVASVTLMTHFATADEDVGIDAALAIFDQYTEGLHQPRSLANSATVLRYPQAHFDWVRPGIMLYGATPVSGQPATQFGLRPVMKLHSELIAIQTLRAGEGVGYGQTFRADQEMRIGIVACGYADGYPRHAPTGTLIAVDGVLTRTVGRVSMDMLFVDLRDHPSAIVGSKVELWGDLVPVDAVAESAGTVGYELLCALAPRVPVLVEH